MKDRTPAAIVVAPVGILVGGIILNVGAPALGVPILFGAMMWLFWEALDFSPPPSRYRADPFQESSGPPEQHFHTHYHQDTLPAVEYTEGHQVRITRGQIEVTRIRRAIRR